MTCFIRLLFFKASVLYSTQRTIFESALPLRSIHCFQRAATHIILYPEARFAYTTNFNI